MKSPLLMRLTLVSIARIMSLKQRPISFLLTLDTAQISRRKERNYWPGRFSFIKSKINRQTKTDGQIAKHWNEWIFTNKGTGSTQPHRQHSYKLTDRHAECKDGLQINKFAEHIIFLLSKNRLPAKLSRNAYFFWLVLSPILLSR